MTKYIVVYDDYGWDLDENPQSPNKVVSDLFNTWKEAYSKATKMKHTNEELDYTFYGNIRVVEIEI